MINRNTLRARELRKNQTDAEIILWNILRNRQLENFKFRRQVVVGRYIVDFLSFEKRLIIELDGIQHMEPKEIEKDNKRTSYLQEKGYKVIRFLNNDVLTNLAGVTETILNISTSP